MATTKRYKVGRIRERLAEILSKETEHVFCPEDLNSNFPVYASAQWDGCSWDGYAYDPNASGERQAVCHVYSWDMMSAIVKAYPKYGIQFTHDGFDMEVHAGEPEVRKEGE